MGACVKSHLAQSLQQDGDARQSLGSPLVVTVTKHETHQLRISGTHRLLKNWERERESKTEPLTQASSKIYVHEQFKGGSENCQNWSGPKEKLEPPITHLSLISCSYIWTAHLVS